MGNISSAFQDALAAQAKAALVEVVTGNPRITVKDLAELVANNPNLGTLTLDELVSLPGAPSKPGPGRGGRRRIIGAPAAPAAPSAQSAAGSRKLAKKAGGTHKRNVRTETGREAFDAEVLETLKQHGGDNVSATSLRNALDSDPTQLRAALNRLIERGTVTFSGKARGTRYSLA